MYIWSRALDHVYRLGRQVAALRVGGYRREAMGVYEAAMIFMDSFGYGDSGRTTLASVFRMARMDDVTKSLWIEPTDGVTPAPDRAARPT